MPARYVIHELSANAVMMNALLGEDGVYGFHLGEEATRKCISPSAPKTQDDCALFYQIMCQLHPEGFSSVGVISDLADILIYIDFSRIFDRVAKQKKYLDRQAKARDMFRPDGITLDFGRGAFRYVAFERSASMSRNARISFIREDFYAPVRQRIMLGMAIGSCQLSKLYAYNGLMLTSGFRVEDLEIWDARRIVVVDNPVSVVTNAKMITVEDDGTDSALRRYHRVEKTGDVEVTEFDGEGLISREYAEKIDYLFCGQTVHSSFQIRMPYIKGVVHSVDFKQMFAELGVATITDLWGEKHNISSVDLILTKSMFKGFGWMTENGLSWSEYLRRCREYRHALYISGVGQPESDPFTVLNYQFLNTAAVKNEEFRLSALPDGWTYNPVLEERDWLTKSTELQYYRYAASREERLNYYKAALNTVNTASEAGLWTCIIQKNPAFIDEAIISRQFETKAEKVLRDYAMGNLYAAGDNRYLSGDLIRFIKVLVQDTADEIVLLELERECLKSGEIYAPGAVYAPSDRYTLLRNPHIARNEEAMVTPMEEVGYFRQKYLSHLSYVIMVDSGTLIPERLGGADFDGDMIKTIADPLMNECVGRNYGAHYDIMGRSLPVLIIPSADPQIRDAGDWEARFETIRATFDSRIGQICNAAFDRSIVAYDENSDAEERARLREETEVLEILTGLEIDSAKSGIKPDLSPYLGKKIVSRSLFLKYKNIVRNSTGRAWYEPTQKEKLDKFFASVDWNSVTSNVERLPYLAKKLKENTPVLKSEPAPDEALFRFARKKNWKEKLPPEAMAFMKALISDYETVLKRIRFLRIEPKRMTRRSDIERILYMRGQENDYTPEELYGVFQNVGAEQMAYFRWLLRERQWHLTNPGERESILMQVLPYEWQEEYMELFSDFRHHGYRLLGDVICDYDDMYRAEAAKENARRRDSDSGLIKGILEDYLKGQSGDYERLAALRTRQYMNLHLSTDEALQCAVAFGKRDFIYKVLLDRVEANAVKGR